MLFRIVPELNLMTLGPRALLFLFSIIGKAFAYRRDSDNSCDLLDKFFTSGRYNKNEKNRPIRFVK